MEARLIDASYGEDMCGEFTLPALDDRQIQKELDEFDAFLDEQE